MKKYIKFILPFLLCIMLSIPVFAASSIDVNSLNLDSIDESQLESVKEVLQNVDTSEYSSSLNGTTVNEIASGNLNSVDTSSISMSDIASIYEDLSEVLSNDEIATLLEDNSDILEDVGINNTTLSAGTTILRSLSSDDVSELLQNDIDIDELVELYKNGASVQEILNYVASNASASSTISIIFKALFSNIYVRIALFILILIVIYSLFVTSKIFKKAGRKGFATIIPIYRDVVHLKVCSLSPWLLLFVFIPILGWLILLSVAIVRKIRTC